MPYVEGYRDGLRFAARMTLFHEHASEKCVHPCEADNDHCVCRQWAQDETRIDAKIQLWENET